MTVGVQVAAMSNSGIDFSKLEDRALWNYVGHHDIQSVAPNCSKQALAAACARHFNTWQVDESAVISVFRCVAQEDFPSREFGSGAHRFRKRSRPTNNDDREVQDAVKVAPAPPSPPRAIFRKGDKVAAKTISSDENGSWILATILKYYPAESSYEVVDDDETRSKYIVESELVLPLTDTMHGMNKGAQVLALFPDTTSFYRAKLAKAAKRGSQEAHVQFEDDEDETGRTPIRKLEPQWVIPMPIE